MAQWPWIERRFNFDYPATKWPDLLERVRGTPARLEEMVRSLTVGALTYHDGKGWSIQENIGHLLDLEGLVVGRIEEILRGASILTPADMSNRKTCEANHNQTPIDKLLKDFRSSRAKTVPTFERLDESDWGKAAFHERLQTNMRIVDIACMTGEHDDYHLARIRQLIRKVGGTLHMGDQVSWQVELAVKPGELDYFRGLTDEMVESTQSESGVLIYERFISEDGKVVYLYERYADSPAALEHLLAFGKTYGQRFMSMVDRKRFTVFGTPSDALRKMLDEFGATYARPWGGFSR